MLFQLHWQHRTEFHRTQFVAQAEANSGEELEAMQKHFEEVVGRRKDECPDEWCPMICDETSEHFERAVSEAAK